MIEVPDSMSHELAAWNDGAGIDLQSWVGCEGRFSLAVGYASIFWPDFVEFEQYILVRGFSEESLRSFERGASRQSVEWVMNHLHIADIQHVDCDDISRDKIIVLGETLREIYTAKLRWQFPDRNFIVEFAKPDDPEDLQGYQLTFWQE